MKRWIVLSLLMVPLLASAASFWDGNAALQRGDASFESGLYATSNSFPAGTQITIQNQDTGKTITATVTGRIEGQSDILVLISPKTAEALGLSQGTLGRVRVTVPSRTGGSVGAVPGEQTVSSDPDVNPAAAYGKPDAAVASAPAAPSEETLPSPTAAATTPASAALPPVPSSAAPEAPAEEQPAAATQQATTPATTPETTPATTAQATAPATTPAATTTATTASPSTAAEDAAIIAAAQSRIPQKQVFLPPREDEKFAYKKPASTPATTAATTAQPEVPTITAVEGEPGVSPAAQPAADLALADVAAPEESRPEEIVGAGAAAPSPTGEQPQVSLASPDIVPEAGQPQEAVQTEVSAQAVVPPAGQPQPKVALLPPEAPAPASSTPATTTAVATTPTTAVTTPATTATTPVARPAAAQKTGAAGSFFLQLAAYGTEKNARDLAAKLTPTYPAMVLTPSNPKSTVFKVVIGPLNRAESGTLLTWFRYRGFPDAFVKQE